MPVKQKSARKAKAAPGKPAAKKKATGSAYFFGKLKKGLKKLAKFPGKLATKTARKKSAKAPVKKKPVARRKK